MKIPENLRYAKTHEWVEILADGTAKVGITDYAQNMLGDIVYVNLPQEEETFAAGEIFADIESVKTSSELYMPIGGSISAVNMALIEQPELVNADAFDAWFITIDHVQDSEELMNAKEYEAFLETEEEKA
ncbi:MAG: glycine cleavage system protein GcvH [Christensenellaceae bacterium]